MTSAENQPSDVEEGSSAHEQAVRWVADKLGVQPDQIEVTPQFAPSADSGHACPGELTADTYIDSDGYEHIVIGTWYSCESYWEVGEDFTLLQ